MLLHSDPRCFICQRFNGAAWPAANKTVGRRLYFSFSGHWKFNYELLYGTWCLTCCKLRWIDGHTLKVTKYYIPVYIFRDGQYGARMCRPKEAGPPMAHCIRFVSKEFWLAILAHTKNVKERESDSRPTPHVHFHQDCLPYPIRKLG